MPADFQISIQNVTASETLEYCWPTSLDPSRIWRVCWLNSTEAFRPVSETPHLHKYYPCISGGEKLSGPLEDFRIPNQRSSGAHVGLNREHYLPRTWLCSVNILRALLTVNLSIGCIDNPGIMEISRSGDTSYRCQLWMQLYEHGNQSERQQCSATILARLTNIDWERHQTGISQRRRRVKHHSQFYIVPFDPLDRMIWNEILTGTFCESHMAQTRVIVHRFAVCIVKNFISW